MLSEAYRRGREAEKGKGKRAASLYLPAKSSPDRIYREGWNPDHTTAKRLSFDCF